MKALEHVRHRLAELPFSVGVWLLAACAVCYAVSFLQMLLPLSVYTKGVIWFVFFGLAKTCQYSALLVLGAAGIGRLKAAWRRRVKS